MMRLTWVVVVAVGLGTALPALAEEPCAAPARMEVIPAHVRCVERTVVVPAVTCERRVPVYETVMVPTYERVCVPVYEQVETAVWATREVPVVRTVMEPVYRECDVPIYQEVCKPVRVTLWNPFGCEDLDVKLWNTSECVPCGTEKKTMIVGHEPRQVVCGTRLERVQVGTESKSVLVGHREERVARGERAERRQTGWTTEVTVVRPASSRTVIERVPVPCRTVTVVPDESAPVAKPLPSTDEVMGETQFLRTVLLAR